MADEDEDDLKQQRSAVYALGALQDEATSFSRRWRRLCTTGSTVRLHGRLGKHVLRMAELFDYLQEEPQLLDPHLKTLLPPLVDAFLQLVLSGTIASALLRDLATAINTLCKVRGPKVVVKFFNNEARYMQPMLKALWTTSLPDGRSNDDSTIETSTSGDLKKAGTEARDWQVRYVMLLWLSHLMLTPFDLRSLGSGGEAAKEGFAQLFPDQGAPLAAAIARLAMMYLHAPTKEQVSAAKLLVSLALRPDMRRLGVLARLIGLLVSKLSSEQWAHLGVYETSGYFMVLLGLLRGADATDICPYLPALYSGVGTFFTSASEDLLVLQGSATLRRLAIKVRRETVIVLLSIGEVSNVQAQKIAQHMLEDMSVLEDVIDDLLTALGDRDTQVRLAASKSLAVTTAKLGPDMAREIVAAVLDALGEGVRGQNNDNDREKDLAAVSPYRWHGLTMALAHLLFRRSASADQIGQILDALYLSLIFEQRSTSGSSVGVSVRDAANFGLWSLARRYTTKELLECKTTSSSPESVIQQTATQLLVAACLDSAGNVRRGSSAALQELIGRHPDMVRDGIALVQIVDYQAVGLGRRAMISIANHAAQLSHHAQYSYRSALWHGLLHWRGIRASVTATRDLAAASLGQLSKSTPLAELKQNLDGLLATLLALSRREVEQIHGSMQALTSVITSIIDQLSDPSLSAATGHVMTSIINLTQYWALFDSVLAIDSKELSRASMRPELTTSATISFIGALGRFQSCTARSSFPANEAQLPPESVLESFTLCLKTSDPDTLTAIGPACCHLGSCLNTVQGEALCNTWLHSLVTMEHTPRKAGLMIALASLAYADRFLRKGPTEADDLPDIWNSVDQKLNQLFWNTGDTDTRVLVLRCMTVLQTGPTDDASPGTWSAFQLPSSWAEVLDAGLKDYTLNERGDIGSLLRLEAIASLVRLSPDMTDTGGSYGTQLLLALHRLALERLDKVRLEVAKALHQLHLLDTSTDVSTVAHFTQVILSLLCTSNINITDINVSAGQVPAMHTTFWLGISSSAGAGSDSLLQTARSALYSVFTTLPSQTLHILLTHLLVVLSEHLNNERTILPLLETTSYLLDAGIFGGLLHTTMTYNDRLASQTPQIPYKFMTLLSLVQKAHFKSTQLPKLFVCVHIYRGLVLLPETPDGSLVRLRQETTRKLVSMLAHAYAKVRIATAEALYVVVGAEVQTLLRDLDWGAGDPTDVMKRKATIGKIRGKLGFT